MKTFRTPKGTELPLLNLKGKDYLQAAQRIRWFREEHHDGKILTELVFHDANSAIVKATISISLGINGGDIWLPLATAHKSETLKGFPDFLEKAETGAIARALALCGYGTQFAADEFEEKDRLADSPLSNSNMEPSISHELRHPPAPISNEEPSLTNLGSKSFSFGKHRHIPFRDIPVDKLQGYVDWLRKDSNEKGKKLSLDAEQGIAEAEAFLNFDDLKF